MSGDAYADRQTVRRLFYTQGEGGPLVQDVGICFYEDVSSEMPVAQLEDASLLANLDEPSGGVSGFAALAAHMYTSVREYADLSPQRRAAYNITPEDVDKNTNPGVQGGIVDLQFAAGFIPAMAVHVSRQMVDEGALTEAQRDNWQLHDWANLIDSNWFHALVHEMAITGNAVYRQFGSVPGDYGRSEFHKQSRFDLQLDDSVRLFTLHPSERKDELPSAEVSPELHEALRRAMRERKGFGCPVARKAGPLRLDLITVDDTGQIDSQNPHVAHLMHTGNMHIGRTNHEHNIARYALHHSAIDQAIDGVSAYLRRYEESYGTPQYDRASQSLEHIPRHARKPKSLLLRMLDLG